MKDRAKGDRSFGVLGASILAIVGSTPLLRHEGPRWWALVAAACLLVLALAAPSRLRPAAEAAARLGLLLNGMMSPLVLAILYFGVLTPVGLLMRACGSKPLALHFDTRRDSYWIKRDPPGPGPETMRRQF